MQNPKDIAKEFNNFFTSVGPKLPKKIHHTERRFQDFLISHNEKMKAFNSLKRRKAGFYD